QMVKQLISAHPENKQYSILITNIYSKMDKPQKAIQVYRHLLEKHSGNVYDQLALSVLYKKTHQKELFRQTIKQVFENHELEMEDKIDFVRPFLKYVEVDSTEKSD